MKNVIGIASASVVLASIIWLGLHVKPKPFDPYPGKPAVLQTLPLPDGSPARFRLVHQARQAYRHYIEATFLGIPVLK